MFYERLNQLCRQHGTTITELARTQLGVASSAATNWKHGASPRSDVVTRAAAYFGVSTDYLLGLTDSPVPAASGMAPDIEQAISLLEKASPTARSAALAALQAVVAAIDSSAN
ncbi:MAG: helix-turn-helix transcriptional regulator [Clostridia bacterium]|nr:helix-turn-helix transcriptional regulator [Clostridia bacterium]